MFFAWFLILGKHYIQMEGHLKQITIINW
jgi:hypothetical protein